MVLTDNIFNKISSLHGHLCNTASNDKIDNKWLSIHGCPWHNYEFIRRYAFYDEYSNITKFAYKNGCIIDLDIIQKIRRTLFL